MPHTTGVLIDPVAAVLLKPNWLQLRAASFKIDLQRSPGAKSTCTLNSTVDRFVPGAAYLGCYMHAVHSMLSLPAMSHRGAVNLCAVVVRYSYSTRTVKGKGLSDR